MIIDLATVIFMAAFVLWGAKRGAMKMLLSAISFAISMLVGAFVYRPISGLLTNLGIVDGLSQRLAENMESINELPGIMRDVVSISEVEAELSTAIAGAAVTIISFLAVVILARIVLFIVSTVLGLAGAMPVIKQANGLLGGVGGFAVSLLIVLLAFGVIAVMEVFGSAGIAESIFGDSHLAVMIYDNNPLLGMVVSAAAGMGR